MPCNQVPSKKDEVSGSQTFSQNFHRKVLSNLLRFSDVCLEMSKINLAFSEHIAPLSTLCSCTLKIRLRGTVSNRPNARQSEFFKVPLNGSILH